MGMLGDMPARRGLELDASSGELRPNGTVPNCANSRGGFLLLLSRCTAPTLFESQTTPLPPRFGHAPSHLTAMAPSPSTEV